MEDVQIKISILWVILLLIYIYGDILRMLSGDTLPGKVEVDGKKLSQLMWLGIAFMMLIPISMICLSLFLPQQINRWSNIIISSLWLLFIGLNIHTYKGLYDKFLLLVSLIPNLLIILLSWNW